MNIFFSQTAEHTTNGFIDTVFQKRLLETIHNCTGWNYSCTQKDDCYFLKPSFRNMPYKKSFIPEIDIGISQNNGRTSLHIKGQPVKFVRIFMWVWFAFFLVMEVILLAVAAVSRIDSIFPVFIPVAIGISGYFLCELATKVTFHAVVKAIRKEFP